MSRLVLFWVLTQAFLCERVVFKRSVGSDESLQEGGEGTKHVEGSKKLTFVPGFAQVFSITRNRQSGTQQRPELCYKKSYGDTATVLVNQIFLASESGSSQ